MEVIDRPLPCFILGSKSLNPAHAHGEEDYIVRTPGVGDHWGPSSGLPSTLRILDVPFTNHYLYSFFQVLLNKEEQCFISIVGNGVTMFPRLTLLNRNNYSCESFDNGEHYFKIE